MINSANSKMPLRTAGIFSIILLLAVSITWWLTRNYYNNNKASDRAFLRLDSSLNIASNFLIRACIEDSNYVASKSCRPGYEKILILYKPKIDSVMLIARRMDNYIQSVKQSLSSSISSINDDGFATQSQQNHKEDWNYETAKSLYDSLHSYSKLLLNILPFKMQQYNAIVPIDTSKPYSKNVDIWIKTYFERLTKSAMLSSITELDYQVWQSANIMTNIICSQWSDDLLLDCNLIYPFTTQNTTALLSGQTLEITSGIITHSCSFNPIVVIIDNKKISPNGEQMFVYKKRITNGKGGSIPVIISFRDPNTGEMKTISKQISYNVIQPK